MFKEQKKIMLKKLKKNMATMSKQIEDLNKEAGIIERNQMETLELKDTISKLKNSAGGQEHIWAGKMKKS